MSILLIALLAQVPLAAAEISASPDFPSSLKDRAFRSGAGAGDEDSPGTLLDLRAGVNATGRGVIVGIIDSGIDWRHPDFRDPADSLRSRILAIWDTGAENGPAPEGFEYGREWTREEIEAALRGEGPGPPRDTLGDVRAGHGTYVAGIAAGNGNADSRYLGMAPEAEIVVAAHPSLLDASRYVFGVAERKGLPAVVNVSGGRLPNQLGPERVALEELLREMPGRAMVASAGNWGESGHCHFDLQERASYTIYRAGGLEGRPGSGLGLGAYHQGPGEPWLGIGLSEEEMVWRSLRQLPDAGFDPSALFDSTVDSLQTAGGETRARIGWSAFFAGTDIWYQIVIEDTMPEPADWIVAARGGGVLHLWGPGSDLDEFPEAREDPLFRPLDNGYGIIDPAAFPEVIAVGAYANRDLPIYDDLAVGDLFPFSSRGPTLEGLLKPDLVAPGALTAARSGDSTRYESAAGTSASAPVVAGAVALYFERFPRATNRDVWRALTGTALSDEFTGATPNLDWGYGKLDVAALLAEPPTLVAAGIGALRPTAFSLAQNYPNPFNGRAAIRYQLTRAGLVDLAVHDLLGRPVRRLVAEHQGAGSHQVTWDGADDEGHQVASGVYLYRLEAGHRQLSRRLVLVR